MFWLFTKYKFAHRDWIINSYHALYNYDVFICFTITCGIGKFLFYLMFG